MSKLGKILLIIAAVGGLAAAVAGALVIEKRGEDRSNLASEKQGRATAERQVGQVKEQLKTAQDDKAASDKKVADDEQKIGDMTNELTTAKKQAEDAQTAVTSANDKAKAAQDQLDKITAGMHGKTPEEYMADVAKAQADLTAAQSEKSVLQTQLDGSTKKIQDLMADINNVKAKIEPPGVSGKVTFVDNTWNFVVLDVGLDAGVVPNGELIVYRGKTFLGKLRVTRSDPKDSVAEILPDVKGNIQVGDAVLN